MMKKKQPYILALIPGMFYAMVIFSLILNAKVGFNLSWPVSYDLAVVFTVLYAVVIVRCGKKEIGLFNDCTWKVGCEATWMRWNVGSRL
ncbi:MAG: hypothetical protein U0L92_07245 [Clostridia bacterium]|nr:hypothetical protein [Clostridia bacterium]